MTLVSRRTRNFLLRLIVTVALVAFLATKVDVEHVFMRMRHLDVRYLVGAASLLFFQLVLSGGRWQLVADMLGVRIGLQRAVRLALIGQFFSQALPSAVGGDAVRAWLVSRGDIGFGRALVTVVCDRAIGLVMLLVIACATLPLFFQRVGATGPRTALAALYACLLAAFLLLLWTGPRLLQPFTRFRITAGLHMVLTGLRQLIRPRGRSGYVLLLAVVVQTALILSVYSLAKALGIAIQVGDCFAIVPQVMLAATLPLSIAGWGVREGAMVAGLAFVGVSSTDALALSLSFGLVQLALALPGGLLWLRSGSPARAGLRAWSHTDLDAKNANGNR